MPAALIDATTLITFASVEHMWVLESVLDLDAPVVCEAVLNEIESGANQLRHIAVADRIRNWTGLGSAAEPRFELLPQIEGKRIALAEPGDPAEMHLGEAQSIVLAQDYGCLFITDDFAAFDLALGVLGDGQVWDSVDVLRMAVANGDLTAESAAEVTELMRDAGRSLRRCHPDPMTRRDFDS